MFASLSNFLFGSTSEETEVVAEVELMTSTLPHSDWELVDKVESTESASVPGSVDEILHISPLENALIEHPSMSVYHPTKSKSKPKPKKPAKCPKSAKQRKPQTTGSPRRACAVAARVGLLINAESQQMSQRIAESVSVGHVTKKQCERVNKCMKFVSRGSQAKRNNRPCGSINNRAC